MAEVTKFTWDVPDTDYLIAENKKLRAENERLRTLVNALERDQARMDRAYDRNSDKVDDIIAEKDAKIAMLNMKILKLVGDYV